MRVAAALGDTNGVLRRFRQAYTALAEPGTEPAPTTRALLAAAGPPAPNSASRSSAGSRRPTTADAAK
jgi:DNA-binding SARP family transcriptional activator